MGSSHKPVTECLGCSLIKIALLTNQEQEYFARLHIRNSSTMSTISSSSLSTPYGDDILPTPEHAGIDDDVIMLEGQNDEEQAPTEMLFAECCAAVPPFNIPSAIVLMPTTTDDSSTSLSPQHKEQHAKPTDNDKFDGSRRFILGVLRAMIGGITIVTVAILFLQHRHVPSPTTATTECHLISFSCNDETTDLMTEPLPICAMIEYKHLKIQLQDLTDSTANGPFESCEPSNLALWRVAIDLHRQSIPTATTIIMAASSSTIESLSSIKGNDQDVGTSTNQDLNFPASIWMNRFVLYTLYFSTGTTLPPPTNKDSTCLLEGVICNGQGDIMVLDLANSLFGVGGPLPTELGLLSNSLRALELGSNPFTGKLPSELGHLTLLQTLSIEHNRLTGSLPLELNSLKRLKVLELGHNFFTGSVPAFQLDDLDRLSLTSNKFQGKLPQSLSRSVFLRYVDVSHNQLTGTVDVFYLFNSESMSFLDLSYNTMLDISSSPQALDIGYLSNLKGLSLSGIPLKNDPDIEQFLVSRMHHMPFLTQLHLANMGWQGSLPPSLFFRHRTNLAYLDLSDNSFNGTIPEPPSDMPYFSLDTLHLTNNLLTGFIPWELASLKELSLDGNDFSGVLPQEVCQYIRVLEADFCHNLPVGAACFDEDNHEGCRCFASC
jgi:hypothetical protein